MACPIFRKCQTTQAQTIAELENESLHPVDSMGFRNFRKHESLSDNQTCSGHYEFTAKRAQDWTGAKNAYLVVAAGTTIPNIADLSTALGSTNLKTA